ALGALLNQKEIRVRTVLFSLCAMLSYLVWQFVLLWNWGTMNWLEANLLAVAIIFAIPLAYSSHQVLRGRTVDTP
ncbi:MAG: hypothetical protein M1305_05445, partial [Candidatus Marsarchaeota archaeon]|nr:hypothetical protein [Candidatus Marsarchaeota archaeon]